MGAEVTCMENFVTVMGPPWNSSEMKHSRPVDVDMNKMPDVAMTLDVVALYVDGPTTIRDGDDLMDRQKISRKWLTLFSPGETLNIKFSAQGLLDLLLLSGVMDQLLLFLLLNVVLIRLLVLEFVGVFQDCFWRWINIRQGVQRWFFNSEFYQVLKECIL